MKTERFQTGWAMLQKIDGEAGERVIESLKDISPDLGRFIIEYSFGDVYSRDGLDLKAKEIAVVAALTAMGTALPQLKVHLHGALNTGSSVSELKEVILQMSVYAGFPSCINGMNALKDVLHERQSRGLMDDAGREPSPVPAGSDRLRMGTEQLARLDAEQTERLNAAFQGFSPELVRFVLEYGYADIFSRDNLSPRLRQLATIAALTALGNAQPQLQFHLRAGLNIGLSQDELRELMLLMSVYAGFPAAINGTNALKEVLDDQGR